MMNLPERRARYMRLRVGILYACVLAAAGAVLHRAHELQVRQAPELREMAEEQYNKHIHLPPKRGTIRDRNGAELAVTVNVDSVYANPRKLRANGGEPALVAQRLSSLLGVDAGKLQERLSSDRYFVWVKRRLTPKESQAVMQLELPGVELTKEPRRFYPNRELASHVLGFANLDGKGIEGLELSLDERLRGSARPVPAIRDRRGVVVFSEQLLDDRAAQGDDVVLTIDRTIQRVAERELELAVRTFEARSGSVVVMEPSSGDIIAMASFPSFNPNEPAAVGQAHHRNRAVADRFEPGSTIKPFTVAGALAAGSLSPTQRVPCEDGAMVVGEYTIHDTHKWLELTPAQVLAYSSNIGTAKIAMDLGRQRLYRTLRDFGFGATTDVGLPGEASGSLRHYKRWYEMDAATISFGQGMSATALQLAASFGALANRGQLMQPRLVKRFEDPSGEHDEEPPPRVRRQVVPPRVARTVSEMLIGVTAADGTGAEAALDDYLVAGKTGTAQKADYVKGGYAKDKWTSSFVGFAPANRPRLVVAVIIDEPVIAHYGGTVAGPTFRRVMEAGLRHFGVPGERIEREPVAQAKRKQRSEVEAGEAVAGQVAAAEGEPPTKLGENERRVPSLIGATARQALVAAYRAGLAVQLQGSGVVRAQEPAAGSSVAGGSVVRVTLEPPANRPVTAHEALEANAPPVETGKGELAAAGLGGRP